MVARLCGDGSDSINLLPPKTEHLFRPVATQHISWEVIFTHRNELLHEPLERSHPQNTSWELVSPLCNERRPRLKSLSALPPPDRPPQWNGWNFLKIHGRSNLIFFHFLIFYFGVCENDLFPLAIFLLYIKSPNLEK